ncbi:MAG: pseudouridine synthase [Eubacteriales bacterium]|nr:pseudouridine synthase [Eubacteriales bacterium]
MMRLDRFLCETGFGTRSQVKELLKKGKVLVNGQTVSRPEQKVDETRDQVVCAGTQAVYARRTWLMLHKPAGVVSATEDAREKTVLELLPKERRRGLFPVGRLDKDTEGLLFLTDDGELAHRLLSPRRHVDKTYYARVQGTVTGEHVRRFAEGVSIGDEKPCLPAVLEILEAGEESEILLTIREGRFHQVKRMFEAVGCRVTYLKRRSMGGVPLDPTLRPGEWRSLRPEELSRLEEAGAEAIKECTV